MAEEPTDSIGQAQGRIKWLVGIAITFVGAALAKLDWIQKFSRAAQLASLVAIFFFLLTILFGVFYAFQLVAVSQRRQKLDEAKAKRVGDEIDKAQDRLDSANEKVARFHGATLLMFIVAGMATVICLGFVLLEPSSKPPSSQPPPAQPNPEKSAEVTSGHYALINVPVHVHGRLSHSHTFLLNEKTGDIWLMVCRTDKTVEFKRVQKLKQDGTSEEGMLFSPPLKAAGPN
jgi:hypothetical protein